MTESQKLLADYVQTGSENAFRELVTRYLDLVYSAALRIVEGDTHRAEDVAQTVFVDLARLARTLSADVMLGGWLHRHTCFVAANTLRGERRRQSREKQAVEMNALHDHSETDLTLIAPILDEAINQLGEADRTAVLLRFFEQRDFRSVGEALGSNEDAARIRVTRALEKLHSLLKHRGVTTSATALGVALTANAIQAAPVGLAATISSAAVLAGTTIATTTTATITKAIAMTTLQKTLLTAIIVTAASTGIYEAHQASSLRDQVRTFQQQEAEHIRQLQHERNEATSRLAAMSDENVALKNDSAELQQMRRELSRLKTASIESAAAESDPAQSAAKSWADRVAQLKQRLEQTPGAKIPELKHLTDANWLNAARDPLITDKDYRRAFASLRSAGENQFIILMQKSLQDYLKENDGQFPSDLSQLKPYFETTPDDTMLQRYAIVPASSIPNMKMGGDWLITVKNPVDEEYDSLWALGPKGFGTTTYQGSREASMLAPALEAYKAANNGQDPKDRSDLLPYLTTPEQQAAYQKLEQMRNSAGK